MPKYLIRVARLTYGDIEVEANDRDEAKVEALKLEHCDEIQWEDNSQFRIAEVTRLSGGN